jgi:hypothetical protein
MVLSLAMLTGGLFTLDRARKAQETAIKGARVTEMRSALEGAIQRAATLYRTEAVCDPALLQKKLSYIKTDGFIDESTPTVRQMEVSVNSRTYTVSFGSVTPLTWSGAAVDPSLDMGTKAPVTIGTSQDAEIEVFTSVPNQGTDSGGGTRTSMRAVLINSCLIRCDKKLPTDGVSSPGETCIGASNSTISNGSQTTIDSVPLLVTLPSPSGSNALQVQVRTDVLCQSAVGSTRYLGDIPISTTYDDTNDANEVNALDLSVLTQFLQQRDSSWLETATALDAGSTGPSCADVNLDGEVNELDRNLLQKWLRGYLYRIPTNPNWN